MKYIRSQNLFIICIRKKRKENGVFITDNLEIQNIEKTVCGERDF